MPLICPICWNPLNESDQDTAVVALHCGHVFHQDCVTLWLVENPTCAQCRRSVTDLEADVLKIFPSATDRADLEMSRQLEAMQQAKEEAQMEAERASEKLSELKIECNKQREFAEKLLTELVAQQHKCTELWNRLGCERREQKELSRRLTESEQRASLHEQQTLRLCRQLAASDSGASHADAGKENNHRQDLPRWPPEPPQPPPRCTSMLAWKAVPAEATSTAVKKTAPKSEVTSSAESEGKKAPPVLHQALASGERKQSVSSFNLVYEAEV